MVEPVPKDIFAKLSDALPYSDSEADAAKRKDLWTKLDKNGNGQLTLYELGAGLR